MKSIKEKATEYDRIVKQISPKRKYVDISGRKQFEAGANYVLDILEKELPLEDNKNLNDYGKALVWRLKNCIEQLKK